MGGMTRYLPPRTGIGPVVDQALAGNTQHFFQVDMVREPNALAGQCRHMAVQLCEQTLALYKERWRAQVPISLQRILLQRFNVPQGIAYVIQVVLENTRANANSVRAIGQEGLDDITVLHHEIRLFGAKRFNDLVGLGCHVHEQRFFTGALVVVGVAQHDHRTGFDIAQVGVEQLEFSHHRRVTQGEQGGFELFAGGALGHDVEAWFLGCCTA